MRMLSVIFLAIMMLALNPTVVLADAVQVRASRGDGYGRLTFRWPQPVGHQASRQGDRLVINFSRPIEADLRPAVRGLGQIIASTEAAPNEATVVFRINGEFSVRSEERRVGKERRSRWSPEH